MCFSASCRQENAIFSPDIHQTWPEPFSRALYVSQDISQIPLYTTEDFLWMKEWKEGRSSLSRIEIINNFTGRAVTNNFYQRAARAQGRLSTARHPGQDLGGWICGDSAYFWNAYDTADI